MSRKRRFATTNEPFHPPLQARSRETHRRILDAAGELLKTKTFAALTVAEIAGRSGSSVGAFYARFSDKEALLEQLDGLCAGEVAAAGEERRDPEKLEVQVCGAIGFYVGLFRKRAGLIRALRLRERERKQTEFSRRLRESVVAELVDPVLAARRRVGHPDPQLGAILGSLMVMSAIEERILFPEMTASPVPVTEAAFIKELTRAYLAYLGVS